MQNLRFALPT
uniref:Uncharacterized protein n=1 Tax=Romanomermis culicivorax TaxID=13658 RepID=A0A915IMW7_ROMCU